MRMERDRTGSQMPELPHQPWEIGPAGRAEEGTLSLVEAMNRLLRLFAGTSSRREYLDSVVELVHQWSGCRCVGLRVLDDEGLIPYESYVGFDREFWESENWLSVERDNCICIRVIRGTPDPWDGPAMTAGGSFRVDNSCSFMAGLTSMEAGSYRGLCMRRGFATLAVVPLRYQGRVLGALHLADEREGLVSPAMTDFLESVAPLIGEAVHRFNLEDELRRNSEGEAVLNRLLLMALEDVPLEDLFKRTIELVQSIPWLPILPGGAIRLADGSSPLPVQRGRHHVVTIGVADDPLGVILLPLREDLPLRRRDEQFLAAVGTVLAGIVMRKRAEEAVRESEARFRRLAENAQDLIYRWELKPIPRFAYLSPASLPILGYAPEELCADPDLLHQAIPPEELSTVKQLVAGSSVPRTLTLHWRRPDGRVALLELRNVPVVEGGEVVAVEGIGRDITEREQVSERIRRAERLEMAGRIAGQVAHDFSNLLSPLVGYPQLIRRLLPEGHAAVRYCDALHEAAVKMAEINEDLLTLGRRGRLVMEAVDLNSVVEGAVRLFAEGSSALELRVELAPDLPHLYGQPSQLSRVVTNLLSNAADAVEGVGQVTVRTESLLVEDVHSGIDGLPPGEYLLLAVADNGCGIPPELQEKVFDPFFSTKSADRGRGSGLGLSIVQTIVSDHGGRVVLESEVGKGTVFKVYLPVKPRWMDEVATG